MDILAIRLLASPRTQRPQNRPLADDVPQLLASAIAFLVNFGSHDFKKKKVAILILPCHCTHLRTQGHTFASYKDKVYGIVYIFV